MTSIDSILFTRKFEMAKDSGDRPFPRGYIAATPTNDSFSDSGASTSSPTSSVTSSGCGESDEGVFVHKSRNGPGAKFRELYEEQPLDLTCPKRKRDQVVGNDMKAQSAKTTDGQSLLNRNGLASFFPLPFAYPPSLLQWPYLFSPAALSALAPLGATTTAAAAAAAAAAAVSAPGSTASMLYPGLYSYHNSTARGSPPNVTVSKENREEVTERKSQKPQQATATPFLPYHTQLKQQQVSRHSPTAVKSIGQANDDPGLLADYAKLYKPVERAYKQQSSPTVGYSPNEASMRHVWQDLPTMVTSEFQDGLSGIKRKFQYDNVPAGKKSKKSDERVASFQENNLTEEGLLRPQPVNFKPCRLPCDVCGRTYATIGALAKHAKTHEDPESGNKFNCKICKKECTSLGALRMHIRTHTLPCECHICGKAFSRTWLLQGHIRTHTGEKPYQCTVCSRAFADRSNLRAHMQTHEEVKRYSCSSCDKTFSRISLLKRHQTHCEAITASAAHQPKGV